MHEQQTDVGGRNSGNARSLADGRGPDLGQLLPSLEPKTVDLIVVEGVRYPLPVQTLQSDCFVLLPVDVSGILESDLDLLNNFGREVGAGTGRSEERRVGKECRSRWSWY